jgi:hypothetical protein
LGCFCFEDDRRRTAPVREIAKAEIGGRTTEAALLDRAKVELAKGTGILKTARIVSGSASAPFRN